MREFFLKLQPQTDNFLESLDKTYITEYLQDKSAVNKEVPYNEANMIEVIATVQDYNKLIDDFEKGTLKYDDNMDKLINRDLEKLNREIKNKLDSFRKDNYINNNFYNSVKNEIKSNNFDEIIKKMAGEIVKGVNTQTIPKESPTRKKHK
jgi:predicted phosphohydrolase